MTGLIDTTEMYLRTIYELEEEGIAPLRARIAERLGQSGPTVSQTVARMERDGLLLVADNRHLELSPEGRAMATAVMRRHRLAERLLVDILGLEWEYVHEEACKWEHVISERVEAKIRAVVGHADESPYGTPIPGPDGSAEPADAFLEGLTSLSEVAGHEPLVVVVRRIGEPVQADRPALALLTSSGLLPRRRATVRREGSRVIAALEGQPESSGVSLPDGVADHLYVTAV